MTGRRRRSWVAAGSRGPGAAARAHSPLLTGVLNMSKPCIACLQLLNFSQWKSDAVGAGAGAGRAWSAASPRCQLA